MMNVDKNVDNEDNDRTYENDDKYATDGNRRNDEMMTMVK